APVHLCSPRLQPYPRHLDGTARIGDGAMIPGRISQRAGRLNLESIRTLTPADIERLHIDNHPRLALGDAESLVIQAPRLPKWHPASGEFLLVTPWRHRSELPAVSVTSAFQHADGLLAASR